MQAAGQAELLCGGSPPRLRPDAGRQRSARHICATIGGENEEQAMEDFLGDLLQRIEDSGNEFSERAYTVVGQEIMPLLQVMLVAYVAYYGLQLFLAPRASASPKSSAALSA